MCKWSFSEDSIELERSFRSKNAFCGPAKELFVEFNGNLDSMIDDYNILLKEPHHRDEGMISVVTTVDKKIYSVPKLEESCFSSIMK